MQITGCFMWTILPILYDVENQNRFMGILQICFIGWTIGVVNKGRHVTLKYFSILKKINKEHRLFHSSPGQAQD